MANSLKDLASVIQYDSSWGIWAELIDGKFTPESQARYGQTQFENGGLLDEFNYFADGESIWDHHVNWSGEFNLSDWEDETEDLRFLYRSEATEKEVEDGDNQLSFKDWLKENRERSDVAAIIDKAHEKWRKQNAEMSDEWLDQLISDMSEASG